MDSKIKQLFQAWKRLGIRNLEIVSTGLINQTYQLQSDTETYIFQKLNPIFKPEVNYNVLAVTDYLAESNFLTPRLIKTDSGELCVLKNSECWRMLSFIEGQSFDQLQSSEMAYSAGQLVGRFHRVLFNFHYDYQALRSHVHDTKSYLFRLEAVLKNNLTHPFYKQVAPVANKIIDEARKIPDLFNLPLRHSHGDLKISNLLFDEHEKAICLIDLDTLGKLPWPIEMGDAFRSWCNLKGEDQPRSSFDFSIYQAALEGYQESVWDYWSAQEKEALHFGIRLIPLELSARFLIDIFENNYFKWDSTRFESREQHNWIRALGQWTLFESIESQKI